MTEVTRKPKVLLIAWGGTISMVKDRETGRSAPRLSAAALLDKISCLEQVEVSCVDAPAALHILRQPADLLVMARFLQDHIRDDIDGVVVTHGTDALEEVAYFIDETLISSIPIVFTGSMRPGWAIDYDGVRNLENAFRLASVATAKHGVLVTMHDEIFEAWSAYKTDTVALDSFAARRGAVFGRIHDHDVELPWRSESHSRFGVIPQSLPSSVPTLLMGVGDDGAILDAVERSAIAGLVVAGMGAGSIPTLAQKKIMTLARKKIPVVLCSSASSGPTAAEQYYPGAYTELRAAGVVIENRLNARKTRIRLLLSLGLGLPYAPFGE